MDEKVKISGIYAMTLIVATCSIVYELLCAQTLSMLAGNMVKWYSLTIGIYLSAMGTGALLVDRLVNRWGIWNSLVYVEIALSVMGALAVAMIYMAHTGHSFLLVHTMPVKAQLLFFGGTFLVISIIGILTGFELPLLIKAGNATAEGVKVTNRVLGVDYLGSLLGAISFPLLLLPNLSLIAIGFIMALLNIAVAIWLVARSQDQAKLRLPKFAFSGLVAVILVAGMFNLGFIEQIFLKKYFYYREASASLMTLFMPMELYPNVFHTRSPYQQIDIVENIHRDKRHLLDKYYSTKLAEEPDYPLDVILYLNGDFQLASRYDEIYHEFFAHVPINRVNKVPEEILVLGAGDGLLIKELLKYKQVRSIIHVDLDPELVRLANTHPQLVAMNHGSLMDPRVTTIVGDGYQYVRNLDRKFEAIYIDFPDARDYNLAKLYSAEFYHFIRQHLTPNGFAVSDVSGISAFAYHHSDGRRIMSPRNTWPVYYNTLRKAGFETIEPYVSSMGFENKKAKEMLQREFPLVSKVGWKTAHGSEKYANWEGYLAAWDQSINDLQISFSLGLEQGFILFANEPLPALGVFNDFGIKLHALTPERYRMSFGFYFDKPEKIDLAKVNSIMRPTLPVEGIRYIRLPYKVVSSEAYRQTQSQQVSVSGSPARE